MSIGKKIKKTETTNTPDGRHYNNKPHEVIYNVDACHKRFVDSILKDEMLNKELAEALGVGRNVISNIRCKNHAIHLDFALKYANLTNTSLESLIAGTPAHKYDKYDIDKVMSNVAKLFKQTSSSCTKDFNYATFYNYINKDLAYFQKNFQLKYLLMLCNFHQAHLEDILDGSFQPSPKNMRKSRKKNNK